MDDLLATLDPDQREAACLPDGPAQIVAPAGSGKTTTLVARLGVLLGRGVAPEAIAVVTFNREAAAELAARIGAQLGPRFPGAERIEVRTLHAMARQVLLDAGGIGELVADRAPLLRASRRAVLRRQASTDHPPPEVDALDAHLSRWKVEGIPPPEEARPSLDAYTELLARRRAIDFDDLVAGAANRLERDAALRARWQARFTHLAVDEFQDVDAAQLRLVRVLAGDRANLFVVGDDDQTIYAWRLADVRRILGFRDWYPAARRVHPGHELPMPAGSRCRRAAAGGAQRRALRQADSRRPRRPDGGDRRDRDRRGRLAGSPDAACLRRGRAWRPRVLPRPHAQRAHPRCCWRSPTPGCRTLPRFRRRSTRSP